MNDVNKSNEVLEQLTFKDISHLFAQLTSQTVEQFYQGYQRWHQQQQIEYLKLQKSVLHQQIDENTEQMQHVEPTPIALAALAQLQAHGVQDVALLERMFERGEEWLDHSMVLLERCQELDVIRDDYTEWCEHALEGAYEWIASMDEEEEEEETAPDNEEHKAEVAGQSDVTEEILLQKLMSETDSETTKNSIEAETPELVDMSEATQSLHEAILEMAQTEEATIGDQATEITEQEDEPAEEEIAELSAEVLAQNGEQEEGSISSVDAAEVVQSAQHSNGKKPATVTKRSGFSRWLLAKILRL